jgi:predicted alpha/beta-fold hydrolase
MNRRGHGNTPLLNRTLPSTSKHEDIRAALQKISNLMPKSPIYAVGFSAGASYLGN